MDNVVRDRLVPRRRELAARRAAQPLPDPGLARILAEGMLVLRRSAMRKENIPTWGRAHRFRYRVRTTPRRHGIARWVRFPMRQFSCRLDRGGVALVA